MPILVTFGNRDHVGIIEGSVDVPVETFLWGLSLRMLANYFQISDIRKFMHFAKSDPLLKFLTPFIALECICLDAKALHEGDPSLGFIAFF